MKTETVTDLKITNDFMFARIMEDETICKALLETILHIHIREIHYLEIQKTMAINVETHGIRLDIYVEDDKQVYNIEIQTSDNKNLAKRCRYYQSNIDMDLLKKGEDYFNLKKSFVIFICTFDPFDLGLYQYTFKNFCQENKALGLEDGTEKIFLNTEGKKGNIGNNLMQLLDYFETQKLNDNPLVEKIEKAVQMANKDKKWRRDVMTLELKFRDKYHEGEQMGKQVGLQMGEQIGLKKGRQDGNREGKSEAKREFAKRLLEKNQPISFIAEVTSLDEDEIREMMEE